MSKVAVVTDSTAYIPEEMLAGNPIHTIPLQVVWGNDTFRDGIDITPLEFYSRLQSATVMPTTSQPSPAAFQQVYATLLDSGYDILSMHISSKLSGTMDSAIQAKQMLASDRISIIDSKATSMALGFPVLMAARAAREGGSLEEVHQLALKATESVGVLFVVSTLEYLHRGGRIGGAAAFVGTALGLKPILELRDGRIEAAEKVRTMSKAIDRMLDLFVLKIGGRTPVHIAAVHANAPAEAEKVLERACERFAPSQIVEAFSTSVSPVIGVHAGPGTVGLAFMAGI